MKIRFTQNFKKLISIYIISYFGIYLIYSFLNWFLITKTKIFHINEKYANYWIPILLCFFVTYFIFRPLVLKTKFGTKATDFSLWFLIPFSLGFPIAFSQNLYKNYDYKVINVEKATDVLKYPDEKYFKINKFYVSKNKVFVVKESHTVGKYGSKLVVSNYATTAMYNESSEANKPSKLAYGIHFSVGISNRVFDSKQKIEIKKFDSTSYKEYEKYDFYKSHFFERIFDSDDATYFAESWKRNLSSDKNIKPVVLEKMDRSLAEIKATNRKLAFNSLFYSFIIAIIFLLIFEFSKKRR